MKKRILLALFLALCLTLVLCACGGDEDTEPSGDDTTSSIDSSKNESKPDANGGNGDTNNGVSNDGGTSNGGNGGNNGAGNSDDGENGEVGENDSNDEGNNENKEFSQGLAYLLNDNSTYTVVGVGICEDAEIRIPSEYEGKPVTSIGDMAFYGCSSVASVEIPKSITSIGFQAFSLCESLTIYCQAAAKPNGWHDGWTDSSRPIVWNCSNNDVADNGYIYTVIDGIRYGIKDGVTMVVRQPNTINGAIVIPESITYKGVSYPVTSVGSAAFCECVYLKSVTIPKSVTIMGEFVFMHCIALTSVEVSADNPAYMSIDGNLYTKDGKILIQYAIGKQDTEFAIPDGVTRIDDMAFGVCKLTSVEIPESVTSIGELAFYSCSSLTSIVIPRSVTSIGDSAFWYCTSLTIYCAANRQPDGWTSNWNPSNCTVEWGYNS